MSTQHTGKCIERAYLRILQDLLDAPEKQDRTGTGTRSLFGLQMAHDMRTGFPLLTTKKVFLRGIIAELLWFLSGDTNNKTLTDQGVHIWDEWAGKKGELGPIYGEQWRDWDDHCGEFDQIKELLRNLKKDPFSRRHIVSAWNPRVLPTSKVSPKRNAELGRQALPPCHTMFQLNCEDSDGEKWIDLQLYQRSGDWFLGVPFNIASYALLLMMIAREVGRTPRFFIHTFGDAHLYSNHVEQAKEQLRNLTLQLPRMVLNPSVKNVLDFTIDDFALTNYQSYGTIKAPVAI